MLFNIKMKNKFKVLLISLLFLVLTIGCINSIAIIGTWQTDSFIGERTITFEANGTGVVESSLGNLAFDYKVIDHNTIRFDPKQEFFGYEIGPRIVSYELVNNNTLIFDGTTYTR